MRRIGSAALYFRGPGETNSEDGRVERRVETGAGPQKLEFLTSRPLKAIEAVRLRLLAGDDSPPVAYVKILSVVVAAGDRLSHTSGRLATAFNRGQLEAEFSLSGLVFNDRVLGELYVLDDRDPCLEWRVPESCGASPDAPLVLETVLDYLPDDGFILARDRFIDRQERFEDRIRDLESRLAGLEKCEQALEHYRGLSLWRHFLRIQDWRDRIAEAGREGALKAPLKLLDPGWWSRRSFNEYERWRNVNGYQCRPDE